MSLFASLPFDAIQFTIGTFITYMSAKVTGGIMAYKSNSRKRRGLPMIELMILSVILGMIIGVYGFLSRPSRNIRKWKRKGFKKFISH